MFTPNLTPEEFEAFLEKNHLFQDNKWTKGLDYTTAWNTCPNPHFLLALAPLNLIESTQISCHWARLVLHLANAGETKPRLAVEAAEFFLRGEITEKECQRAADEALDITASDKITGNIAYCAAHAAMQAITPYENYLYRISMSGAKAYGTFMVYKNNDFIEPIAHEASATTSREHYNRFLNNRTEYDDYGIVRSNWMEIADEASEGAKMLVYDKYESAYYLEMLKAQAGILRLYVEQPALKI
ncbi:hypothetical protein Q5H93_02445 [Hymenobacter sp. ASUV-10]|uniref:Uncharacterized protein n=2 Tax=Hymenobacter aranciens TaxID=3063996 RepID=A0ABT9B5M9_9BACT|nr:hypothetical protein [Hymenobacter sp. ASUV-10]